MRKRCLNLGNGVSVQTDGGPISPEVINEIRRMADIIVERLKAQSKGDDDVSNKQAYWKLDRLERYFVTQGEMIRAIKALRTRKPTMGLKEAHEFVCNARTYAERYPQTGYELKP